MCNCVDKDILYKKFFHMNIIITLKHAECTQYTVTVNKLVTIALASASAHRNHSFHDFAAILNPQVSELCSKNLSRNNYQWEAVTITWLL